MLVKPTFTWIASEIAQADGLSYDAVSAKSKVRKVERTIRLRYGLFYDLIRIYCNNRYGHPGDKFATVIDDRPRDLWGRRLSCQSQHQADNQIHLNPLCNQSDPNGAAVRRVTYK